jgi:hypothetical protein
LENLVFSRSLSFAKGWHADAPSGRKKNAQYQNWRFGLVTGSK